MDFGLKTLAIRVKNGSNFYAVETDSTPPVEENLPARGESRALCEIQSRSALATNPFITLCENSR